jgi:hypothetical protein
MTWALSTGAKSAAINPVATLCNSGSIGIYSGTRPATPNTAITSQVLLAQPEFGATAFGSASAGVATANAITSENAVATGTASWARIYESDGVTVVGDCDVSATGGSGDLTFPSVSFVSGQSIGVSSLTLTQP